MPFTDRDKKDILEYGEQEYHRGYLNGVHEGHLAGYSDAQDAEHAKGYYKGLLHGLLIGTIGLCLGMLWCDQTSCPKT
jgi:hypothetical protein